MTRSICIRTKMGISYDLHLADNDPGDFSEIELYENYRLIKRLYITEAIEATVKAVLQNLGVKTVQ